MHQHCACWCDQLYTRGTDSDWTRHLHDAGGGGDGRVELVEHGYARRHEHHVPQRGAEGLGDVDEVAVLTSTTAHGQPRSPKPTTSLNAAKTLNTVSRSQLRSQHRHERRTAPTCNAAATTYIPVVEIGVVASANWATRERTVRKHTARRHFRHQRIAIKTGSETHKLGPVVRT